MNENNLIISTVREKLQNVLDETLDNVGYIEEAIQKLAEQEQMLEEQKKQDDLTVLKQKLENEIQVLNKRIKYREGPCFHDEEKAIERFHSEAFAYERVIKMIDVLKGDLNEKTTNHTNYYYCGGALCAVCSSSMVKLANRGIRASS